MITTDAEVRAAYRASVWWLQLTIMSMVTLTIGGACVFYGRANQHPMLFWGLPFFIIGVLVFPVAVYIWRVKLAVFEAKAEGIEVHE